MDTTETTPAIGEYLDAVRSALVAAGIGLSLHTRRGCNPPTARITTTHRRGDSTDPNRYVAVIEWDAERGWSAGWYENTHGGGQVHDRAWFDVPLTARPERVAVAVTDWFSTPERFASTPAAHPSWELDGLLAAYGPTQTETSKPDLNEEYRQLRADMAADGLGPAGHKRAAELILATYGDEFSQFDLAAGQIHATLATGSADDLAHLENELAAAQHKLKRGLAERADLTSHLQHLHALLADADTKTGQAEKDARAAQLDADRYHTQNTAVRELAHALRQEGMPAIARRIEAAMHDADIEVAMQRAAGSMREEPEEVPVRTRSCHCGNPGRDFCPTCDGPKCGPCGRWLYGQEPGSLTHKDGTPACSSMPTEKADTGGHSS